MDHGRKALPHLTFEMCKIHRIDVHGGHRGSLEMWDGSLDLVSAIHFLTIDPTCSVPIIVDSESARITLVSG